VVTENTIEVGTSTVTDPFYVWGGECTPPVKL
jgi:hypothetical protein